MFLNMKKLNSIVSYVLKSEKYKHFEVNKSNEFSRKTLIQMNCIFTILIILVSLNTFGQRNYEKYDGPIPSGETIGKYTLYAIGLAVLGFIVFSISEILEKGSNLGLVIGCMGLLLFAAAFLCLFPLFAWIESYNNTIVLIILGLALLFFLITRLF